MADTQSPSPKDRRDMPAGGNLPIVIHAQYVRDLSFENPEAPVSLRGINTNPEMDVNIGMDARKLVDGQAENLYEVVLNVRAQATAGDKTLFLAELQYGMTVSLNDIAEEQHHPILFIEIPRMAFPYARQILSDLTTQGGFPPLLLNPVDFHALYLDRFKEEIAEAQKELEEAGKQATAQGALN